MKSSYGFLVLALALIVFVAPAHALTDTFDSIDPTWVTDRQEPSDGFTSVSFMGDNRLRIGIDASEQSTSGGFYYTEGRVRNDVATSPTWSVSADVYVDSGFNTTTGTLARSDMWMRDSNSVELLANYPILGFTNGSPTDGFNPSAADRSFRFRAWDSAIGWIDLGVPSGFVFDEWHNLKIVGDGLGFKFYIDNALVHDDLTGSEIGSEALQSVYLQAYNFGDEDYAVHWDNLQVVPEPASLALLGLGVLGLTMRRRHHA